MSEGAGGEGALVTARVLAGRLGDVSIGSIYKMAARGLIPSQPWGPRKGGRRFVEKEVRTALAALHQPLKEYHAPLESGASVAALMANITGGSLREKDCQRILERIDAAEKAERITVLEARDLRTAVANNSLGR